MKFLFDFCLNSLIVSLTIVFFFIASNCDFVRSFFDIVTNAHTRISFLASYWCAHSPASSPRSSNPYTRSRNLDKWTNKRCNFGVTLIFRYLHKFSIASQYRIALSTSESFKCNRFLKRIEKKASKWPKKRAYIPNTSPISLSLQFFFPSGILCRNSVIYFATPPPQLIRSRHPFPWISPV